MEKNNKKSKINEYNIFSLNIQLFSTIAVIVLLILYLFKIVSLGVLEIVIGLTLLVISYNNYWVFRRKEYTAIYIIVGSIVILVGILTIVGVV